MSVKHKSMACGCVRAASRASGAVAVPGTDRRCGGTRTQRNSVVETAAHAELRLELDGEVERTATGFNAATPTRRMFVPYDRTCDPAVALVICKAQGLVLAKLASMDDATAAITYALTFPRSVMEN